MPSPTLERGDLARGDREPIHPLPPPREGRGYAHVLLEAALGAFPQARCVHLEVRPSNVPARSLYESLGFVTTGRRRRYYGDEDALLMTRFLPARR